MKMKKTVPYIAVLGTVLISSGCANLGGNASLEAAIARAQATADEALRQSKAANMKADEALLLIRGTSDDPAATTSTRGIAEQALKEAKEAKEAAANANKRAERMFRKSLTK